MSQNQQPHLAKTEHIADLPPLSGPGPAGGPAPQPDYLAAIGSRIGPYELKSVLGEGGFGVVYLAEQVEGVRREVALKIIKAGMDTRRVLTRFEIERQALAMMSHPNIAAVLDAGVTEKGRPYFVMELVRGLPITNHCDRRRLSIDRRLGLFLSVCDAVQHAHQKGIIHRDLKPSNVMITDHDGRESVKIIDFGVAKAISQPLTERTLFTETGQLIGTPEYMSPEQAQMEVERVDTRTDIYSLGVLLYELLTGALPFEGKELRSKGFAEIQRVIGEQEPPTPSQRLEQLRDHAVTLAEQRRTDPRTHRRRLFGELDWIVMKALEKDPARRYATATALAEDVEGFRNNEPVAAGPPRPGYRAGKWMKRNRTKVAVSAVIVLELLAGSVASIVLLVQAQRARSQAEQDRHQAARRLQRVESQLTQTRVDWARRHVDVLEDLLTVRRNALGPDHPDTRATAQRLDEALAELQAASGQQDDTNGREDIERRRRELQAATFSKPPAAEQEGGTDGR